MPGSPVDASTGTSLPVDDADVIVGEVNKTFEPLKPEDIAPVREQQATPTDEATPASNPTTDDGAPPPLEVTPASSDQQLLGCLRDILLVLVSIVLGATFALTLLLVLNGTLFLNDREKAAVLEVKVATLEENQDELEQQLAEQEDAIATVEAQWRDVDARVQGVESSVQSLAEEQEDLTNQVTALQNQTDEIEQSAETIRQDVAGVQDRLDGVQDRVAGLDETVVTMKGDMEQVKETAARFDRFVQGLIALISEIAPEELRPTKTVTGTAPAPAPEVETPPAPTEEPSSLQIFPSQHPLPTPASGSGVIYGVVWLDANGNGKPEADETALSGVQVILQDDRGNVLLSMTTGADGRFAFINIPPGDYQLLAHPAAEHPLIVPDPQPVTVIPDERVETNIALTRP